MSKQCISSNCPEPWQTHRPMALFRFASPGRRRLIEVDACMAAAITAVWECGIETLGSCCTHGDGKPEIIVKDNATAEEIQRARKAIATVDEREFVILSWTLNRYEQ